MLAKCSWIKELARRSPRSWRFIEMFLNNLVCLPTYPAATACQENIPCLCDYEFSWPPRQMFLQKTFDFPAGLSTMAQQLFKHLPSLQPCWPWRRWEGHRSNTSLAVQPARERFDLLEWACVPGAKLEYVSNTMQDQDSITTCTWWPWELEWWRKLEEQSQEFRH